MSRYTREEVQDTMYGVLEHLRSGGVITSMHGLGFAAAEKARRKGLSTMRVDLRIFDLLVEEEA